MLQVVEIFPDKFIGQSQPPAVNDVYKVVGDVKWDCTPDSPTWVQECDSDGNCEDGDTKDYITSIAGISARLTMDPFKEIVYLEAEVSMSCVTLTLTLTLL